MQSVICILTLNPWASLTSLSDCSSLTLADCVSRRTALSVTAYCCSRKASDMGTLSPLNPHPPATPASSTFWHNSARCCECCVLACMLRSLPGQGFLLLWLLSRRRRAKILYSLFLFGLRSRELDAQIWHRLHLFSPFFSSAHFFLPSCLPSHYPCIPPSVCPCDSHSSVSSSSFSCLIILPPSLSLSLF